MPEPFKIPIEFAEEKIEPVPIKTESASEKISEDIYLATALENLAKISRTAAGTIDVSSSNEKSGQMRQDRSQEDIAKQARENFMATNQYLFSERARRFTSVDELREFVEGVARKINNGITKEGVLFRQHDSTKYPYTLSGELALSMQEFYETLFRKMDDPSSSPEELAAWIEYRMNLTDHFFADGCGKTSMAMANFTLMRSGHSLPTYPSRKELFEHAPKNRRLADSEDLQFNDWLAYYKSFFETKKEEASSGE